MLIPNFDLQAFNTLAIPARSRYFAKVADVESLLDVLQQSKALDLPLLVLGGGSNLVLASDFLGIALKIELLGRDIVREDEQHVWLRIGAGESWSQLVDYCAGFHYWGLENLALIPGSVGAAPIQNIGAYGVELKDVFSELETVQMSSGLKVTFDADACRFGYRDSVFKGACKDQYIITSVTLRLSKQPSPHLSYPALSAILADFDENVLTPVDIAAAVSAIRRSKLPAVEDIPNAGSFFKNPIISHEHFKRLKSEFDAIVAYDLGEAGVKLAAGWLIEYNQWKGKTLGAAAVHAQQALVLTNPGRGKSADLLKLAANIQASIFKTFAVNLEIEPRVTESS